MSHLHRQLLHDGPFCALALVRCRHPHGGPGEEEESGRTAIVLPVSGLFVRHIQGRKVVGSAAQLLFFNRGETSRVSHPIDSGDDCLSLVFEDAVLLDALAHHDPSAEARPHRPFLRTHRRVEPAEALAFQTLRWRLAQGAATGLEAEERSLALLSGLASGGAEGSSATDPPRSRRREWSEAVQLLLAKDLGRDHSLAELGQAVACSPFHLTRAFRQEVGLPIHRYALRQRLLLALEALAQGKRNLAALALDLGFSSHSHFSTTFLRTFGLAPSAFRARAKGKLLGELRKNLKA